MDESEKRKRNEAFKNLKEWLAQPSNLANPLSTDAHALENYLSQTKDIRLPEAHRLIAFVEFLSHKLSWKQICAVYEFMLETDTPEERNGTYAVWISKSEDILSETYPTIEIRDEIAMDLFSIYERALTDSPGQPGLALGLGTRYLKESARKDGDEENMALAVAWLNRAVEWLGPKEKRDAFDEYLLANCNLRLGQCYMLLRVYKLALEHLTAASNAACLKNDELSELIEVIAKCSSEISPND